MKNILNYFYQIVVNDNDIDNEGYFFYNDNLWQIKKYIRNILEIDKLVILNNYMYINNIKINKIVFNINNEPLSLYEKDYFILLKIDYKDLSITNFNTLLAPNIKDFDILKRNDWFYLWCNKIDYIEYQIEHLMHKYPLLYDTVNYYIGLAENAIIYFKMLDLRNEKLYINHRRLNDDKTFFDPTELVIDYKIRDLCEYIKNGFFYKNMSKYDVINYIKSINLDRMDYLLLYTRMLFPSYYFDLYDNILKGLNEEKDILIITNMQREYEEVLYELQLVLKKVVNVLEISWLNP